MSRTKTRREANLRSSIYRGKGGYWHGRVTVGVRDDGTPDRRHVMSRDKAEVTAKVRQLERQRDNSAVIKPGRAWTVERWLTHWLENIAKPSVRYKPYIGYRTAVNQHLIPGLGADRIDRVQPEHFEKLYARMLARGLSECLINRHWGRMGCLLVVCRSAGMRGAGPMIPMCDDQEDGTRACPGYAPARTAGQGLSQ